MGSSALLLSLPINYSHKCNSYGLRWTLCWVAGWGFAAVYVLSRTEIKRSEYSYLLVRNPQSQLLKLSSQSTFLPEKTRPLFLRAQLGNLPLLFCQNSLQAWKLVGKDEIWACSFLETQRLVGMFYNSAMAIVLFLYLLARFFFHYLLVNSKQFCSSKWIKTVLCNWLAYSYHLHCLW